MIRPRVSGGFVSWENETCAEVRIERCEVEAKSNAVAMVARLVAQGCTEWVACYAVTLPASQLGRIHASEPDQLIEHSFCMFGVHHPHPERATSQVLRKCCGELQPADRATVDGGRRPIGTRTRTGETPLDVINAQIRMQANRFRADALARRHEVAGPRGKRAIGLDTGPRPPTPFTPRIALDDE